ncbi:MAG: hypothetical protein V3U71_04595 [Cocleimonas sp.]
MFKKDDLSVNDKKGKPSNDNKNGSFWLMPMYLVFGIIASLLIACSPLRF